MVSLREQDVQRPYQKFVIGTSGTALAPYARLKRGVDIAAAMILGVVLFLPLFLIVAPLILLDGGPIFYSHRRVGAGGRRFQCYKFRSMVPDADRILDEICANDAEARLQWEQKQKLADDPRVTRIGYFLRKSSLDELPQLWNVLKGDMSLVGPRPIVDDEMARYGRYIDSYLAARPGLTGLWQVRGRDLVEYRGRVAMDVWYQRNSCLTLDLMLIVQTVGIVLGGRGR
jgi:lipopolysaccharide/colanic/teichoic acid biosynthesis glycosyltransferase